AVTVLDRTARTVRTLDPAACGLGYRTSVFKGSQRFVVLDATFRLARRAAAAPLAYAELAAALGVELGAAPPASEVREAVLALRRAKGMVLDPDDPDTVSAGSFFTNPVLAAADAGRLPSSAPRFPAADGRVKVPAAWLVERAGFTRGYGHGAARISTKHTLALTNRGGATAD